MKRVLLIVMVLTLCLSFAACGIDKGLESMLDLVMEEADKTAEPEDTEQQDEMPSPTPEAIPETSKTIIPITTEQQASGILSFANAAEVFTDPDGFKDKEYMGPFRIISEPLLYEGTIVCYAVGYYGTFTALDFAGIIPEFEVNETVYVKGTIGGKGFVYDDAGNATELLWLAVKETEKDASALQLSVPEQEIKFGEGEFAAESGSLSIEIMSLNFTQGYMFINTITSDSAVKAFTTYYFDIFIHQDDYYGWYSGCDFWINPGMDGYDNIPMPVMYPDKDMTIQFIPFSGDGKLICEPIVIELKLSKE